MPPSELLTLIIFEGNRATIFRFFSLLKSKEPYAGKWHFQKWVVVSIPEKSMHPILAALENMRRCFSAVKDLWQPATQSYKWHFKAGSGFQCMYAHFHFDL